MRFYTVGHSNRTLEEFIAILERFGIQLVVDVRRFPTSRKYPHFNLESLKGALESRGIGYLWMGDRLGGYRKGGYRAFAATEEFRRAVEDLVRLSEGRVVAIMCAERLWFRCHRRFIADALVSMGHEVVHIVEPDRVYVHRSKA
ncbi:MAG TPA: DUF488 domain-containing protein [Aciduliprofundum sp.]|nr:DUF488 domain-containing protein [Aciduliprofundum sp.]